jgi:4-diphosphocytidyl-2-C-methyl-D-erythritol kinase
MLELRLRAPAKINLTLEVLDPRPDGYHGVRSLMVPLELCDQIVITPNPGGFVFACDDPSLDSGDNLVLRALEAVAPPDRNLHIELLKCIPSQAGLGGGSSDAAAILLAALSGAFGPAADRDWLALARDLGSDVPFFLAETGALVEGTGERVTAVGALPPWHVVIVKPPIVVSTAAAYAALDAHPRPSRPRATSLSLRALEALQRGDFAAVEACLSNDFHDIVAADKAQVADAIAALREAGATNALLAGSGSCVFSLLDSSARCAAVVERLTLPAEYRVFPTRFGETNAWRREGTPSG